MSPFLASPVWIGLKYNTLQHDASKLCLVDDGSDDDAESGSGSDYGGQSGSGFDEDFFTSDDVTSRKPATDNDKKSSALGHRTTDKRYSWLVGIIAVVAVHFRFR